MDNPIQGKTEPGKRLIAMAEDFADEFGARAAHYDQEGAFPFEHLEALKHSGYLYAPVPVECGGLGVESAHDLLVASSRLARGDASLTLGVNMHFNVLFTLVRQSRAFQAAGDRPRSAGVMANLEQIVRSGTVIAAAVSEPNQSILRQQTQAARKEGSGWVVNGRKIICSMAPAATHFSVSLGYDDREGVERYAYALMPRETPGLTVHDDWDALGMRGSGSVTVTLEDAPLGERGPGRGSPAGVFSADRLEPVLLSGLAHSSSSLGVAEAAHEIAVYGVAERMRSRGDEVAKPTIQHFAAENSVDVAAARAIFSRALETVDRYFQEHVGARGTTEEANAAFAEAQRAKLFVNQAAVRIVDRAMTLVGGQAYSNRHPLSRLYRDARAGAFMHPLGLNIAYEYVGAATLGTELPSL